MQIKGIIFTEREADIIACVLHLKGAKKIAQILNISPRTIEGHIRNILHKMGVNSQGSIKETVENSPEAHFLKRRYIKIQITSLFFEKIKQIKPQIKKKEIACILDFKKYQNLQEISSILKQVGVSIIDTELNEFKQKDQFEIIELGDKNIKFIENAKNIQSKRIFVCCDKMIIGNNSIIFKSNIIDNTTQDKKYEAVFRVLAILAPRLGIEAEISRFSQLRENLTKIKLDSNLEGNKKTNSETILPRSRKMTILIISIIAFCIILSAAFYISENRILGKRDAQGMNFVLPHKSVLLKREDINNKLDGTFKNRHLSQIIL